MQFWIDATNKWGIEGKPSRVAGYYTSRKCAPGDGKQMQAERNKRATILTSEGEKEKQRLLSEGEKAAIVNKAEAAKQQAILMQKVRLLPASVRLRPRLLPFRRLRKL